MYIVMQFLTKSNGNQNKKLEEIEYVFCGLSNKLAVSIWLSNYLSAIICYIYSVYLRMNQK